MKRFLPIIPNAATWRLIATHSLAITILLGMSALATADGPNKGAGMSRSMGSKMSSSFKQPSMSPKMSSPRTNPVSGFGSKPISGGFKQPQGGNFTPRPKVTPISNSPIVRPGSSVKPGPFTSPVKPFPKNPGPITTVPTFPGKPPIKPFPPIVGGGGVKPPIGPIGPIGPVGPKPPFKPPWGPIGPVVGPIGPIGPKPPLGPKPPIKPPIGPIGPVNPLPFPPKPLPPKPLPPKPPKDHDHDHHHHHHPFWPIGFWPVPRGPIYYPTPVVNNACPVVIGNPGVVSQPPVIVDGPVTGPAPNMIPQVENGSEFTMLVDGDSSQVRLAVLMVNNTQMLLEITSAGQGYVTMKMPQLLLGNVQPATLYLMANETTPLAQVNVEIVQQKAATVSVAR